VVVDVVVVDVVVVDVVVVDVVVVGDGVGAAHVDPPDACSAGTVATVAPPSSFPTTSAPDSPPLPDWASTAIPELGAIPSVTVVPEESWTSATAAPAHTATQLTGPPSATPNDPDPITATTSGAGRTFVGHGAEPMATALSVESSTTNWPHSVADGSTIGWAHIAPRGHGIGPGVVPTGGQGSVEPQVGLASCPSVYARMVTPDALVRVNR
jgi:hypothetical protein